MAKGTKKSLWRRMVVVAVAMTVGLFGSASIQLVNVMLINGDMYKARAVAQQMADTTVDAARGDIYDCNMETLATSATAYNVYITPQDIKSDEQRETIAKGLSELLDVEYDTVLKKTKSSSYYEKVATKIEERLAKKVREFISEKKIGDVVGLDETSKRYYPNDNLASTVLGFVGTDNQGLAGIESKYEEVLAGVPGRVIATKNARGADMPLSYEKVVEPQSGKSLVLTVDKYIQYVSEKYLSEAIEVSKVANKGCVIVMNPKTGGIYAMATEPDYNPNDPFTIYDKATAKKIAAIKDDEKRSSAISAAQQLQWRNKAISDTYEPGSVFKIVTGSAALEENVVNTTSTHFYCNGSIKVGDRRYKCADYMYGGHGNLDLQGAFAHSCNPAFIEIGQMLGIQRFWKYFKSFGMTVKTGVDLPGEAAPVAGVTYHDGSTMTKIDLASESFGQSFNVTPIQMITAVSTAINGGYYVEPHVVGSVIDSAGNVVQTNDTKTKRQVISTKTSKTICEMLESVVTIGTGKNAYIPGYRVGGKTGTAEKLNGKDGEYVASFCGFAPCDDPQVVVLVVLDTPKVANYYGGTVAAPVACDILTDVLPYLGVETQYSGEELKSLDKTTPDLVGKSVENAKSTLTNNGLNYKIMGSGKNVERQVPSAKQPISSGGTVVMYTDGSDSTMVEVPNFKGLTVSQANSLAKSYGLNVKFSGNTLQKSGSIAYSQDYEVGKKVELGTIVTVKFRLVDGND